MTNTFDWAGLWQGAEAAKHDCMFCDCDAPNEAAAAYLRTRIEAAFVPRKQPLHCETCGTDVAEVLCAKCGKWWRDNSPEVHEATARAEAAEARVKVLEEALRRYANVYGVLTDSDREYIAQALGAEHGK